MKKTLLFTVAMIIAVFAFGQKNANLTKTNVERTNAATLISKIFENPAPQNYQPIVFGTNTSKANSDLSSVLIGTTVNIYGALVESQTCMYADRKSGTLMSTRRGDHVTPGSTTHGNKMYGSSSTDGGLTWTDIEVYFGDALGTARYPSGVIANPNESTTLNDMYPVVAGPMAVGGNWSLTYFGSKSFGDANAATLTMPTPDGELVRSSMNATKNAVSIGTNVSTYSGGGDLYSALRLDFYNGKWNSTSNAFDWTQSSVDPKPYIYQESPGSYKSSGDYNIAFNAEGTVGYMFTIASDNRGWEEAPGNYQPIIWKTEDAGATWNILDFYDFGQIPEFYPVLIDLTNEPGKVRPIFKEYYVDGTSNYYATTIDGVVDANDNLHIFGVVNSQYSSHPDSLGYSWSNVKSVIVEMEYKKMENAWYGNFVDTINTQSVGPETSDFKSDPDNVGWDHRLQAGVSADGKRVYVSWTDSDIDFFGLTAPYSDLNPDLKAWSRDITTNMYTLPKNFTFMGEGFGEIHFKYMSPIIPIVNGEYFIPVSYIKIAENGKFADNPLPIYTLNGVKFEESDYSVQSIENKVNFQNQVSACYPNPATNQTKVDVNLKVNANVSVSVKSVTGQTVYANNYGTLSSGVNTITLNTNKLAKGVYFVTVMAGKEQHTNKLIVK